MQDNASIPQVRIEIDALDAQLLVLLKQRSLCVERIGVIKNQTGITAYDAQRESSILDNIKSNNQTEYSNDDLGVIFQAIFRAGIHQQRLYQIKFKES